MRSATCWGRLGIKAMCDEAALMPQHVHSRVPALTPDSPGLETAGYSITSKDVPEMLAYPLSPASARRRA